MAKRFIDTEIFQDEWFSDLTKDGKLLWIYILTNCDHAGIFKINSKLIKFQTGIQDIDKTLEELSNSYLRVSKEYLFCFKFIKFQYPNFPQSSVKQQDGAIKILKKFGLWNDNLNTYITVSEELTNSYVYVYDNVIDNDNVKKVNFEKEKNIPDLKEFGQYALSKNPLLEKDHVKLKYDAWVENGWKDGNNKPIVNWKSKLLQTIPHMKQIAAPEKSNRKAL